MDIVKLPFGQPAPEESDCISIQDAGEGRYLLNGSALVTCSGGEDEVGDSTALIGGQAYASYDDAEAAGLAWAAEQCVETLYVSHSAAN
jgi:hypothetical protein